MDYSLTYELTDSDYKESIYLSGVLIVLIFIIYMNAFENNNYSCKNIFVNTYLYVLVSLIIFHITTMIFIKNNVQITYTNFIKKYGILLTLLGVALIAFLLGFLFKLNDTNIISSHVILLLYISLFSVLLSSLYVILKKNDLYTKVFYNTILFISVLLIVFYFNQDIIKKYLNENNYYAFIILLIVVIIVQVLYILIIGYSKSFKIIISSILLVIFGYLLLFNTQEILNINEKDCKIALDACNRPDSELKCQIENYPNYPQKSSYIFGDIINIFSNIAQLELLSK